MGTRGPHAYGLDPWLWLLIVYNIARVLPYLIPTGVCKSENAGFLRLVFTKIHQKWKKIVKNYPTFLLELSLLQL